MSETPRDVFQRLEGKLGSAEHGSPPAQPARLGPGQSKKHPDIKPFQLLAYSLVTYDAPLDAYLSTLSERWATITETLQRTDSQRTIKHQVFDRNNPQPLRLMLAGVKADTKTQLQRRLSWNSEDTKHLNSAMGVRLKELRDNSGVAEGELPLTFNYAIARGTSGSSKKENRKFSLVAPPDDKIVTYFNDSRAVIRGLLGGCPRSRPKPGIPNW